MLWSQSVFYSQCSWPRVLCRLPKPSGQCSLTECLPWPWHGLRSWSWTPLTSRWANGGGGGGGGGATLRTLGAPFSCSLHPLGVTAHSASVCMAEVVRDTDSRGGETKSRSGQWRFYNVPIQVPKQNGRGLCCLCSQDLCSQDCVLLHPASLVGLFTHGVLRCFVVPPRSCCATIARPRPRGKAARGQHSSTQLPALVTSARIPRNGPWLPFVLWMH